MFVRGDEDGGRGRPSIDWAALSRMDGTVAIYAGPDHVAEFLRALLAHGRSPNEPAALVYDGTLPTQHTVSGSLEELARLAGQTTERRAAMLIVGRVAGLREHLRWFDTRPLFSKRVLVTRPRHQAAELVERLEAEGAETIEAPMIRIVEPEDYAQLDAACARIREFDWIVFTSNNAVEPFIARLLASPHDLRALHGVRLCAVGPGTADRLAAHGLKVDLVPGEHRAEGVAHALAETGDMQGRAVLLPRSDIGREVIGEDLRKRGAQVTEVVAYRTVRTDPERDGGPDVYRLLLERRIDVVTFTSASSVRSFVEVLGAEPAADLLRGVEVAAIGPVTAEAAAQCHITTTIVPSEYTVPAMVSAIAARFERQRLEGDRRTSLEAEGNP
jgi:uroporphyrinogen III methyltransferase/synthase